MTTEDRRKAGARVKAHGEVSQAEQLVVLVAGAAALLMFLVV